MKMESEKRKWNTELNNDFGKRRSELCKAKDYQAAWFKHWCTQLNESPNFHRKQWESKCRFMDAASQAMREGFADPMPPPPGFDSMNFSGSLLGERYFKRVGEILEERAKEHDTQ